VAFIFDLLKTRAQISKYKTMSYREEIQKIYETEGFKGFTRGWAGMFLRDAPGFGLYFCLFEAFKRGLDLPRRESDPHHNGIDIGMRKFVAGGTAGVLTWFFAYPMDTIKSKMQTHEGPDRLRIRDVLPRIIREQGIVRLYRGIHV
jgi:solute carrier family 25 (mitochondrial carnitine/acylcarnitine transporter), member 20/29